MVESETIYYMRCNKCGKYMEGCDNAVHPYDTFKTAVFDAERSGWLCLKNNRHYCEKCRKGFENKQ